MQTIHEPPDFFGTNIYQGAYVRAGAAGQPETLPEPLGHPITAFEWPVTPEALRWAPRLFHERYGKPIVITENGLSCRDWVSLDGKVHDPQRIDYTQRYLRELGKAVADGVPVHGYFHWSIMDNFEWAEGYKQRFGMVFVDYGTQKRTPKDSALWYRQVIATNGAEL
jgi:beta-glucosidase